MFKEVDGELVLVPDTAAVTPALRELRTTANSYLAYLQAYEQTPEGQELKRLFCEGRMSDVKGFDWYLDPNEEKP